MVETQLKRIQEKLQTLLKKHTALQKENAQLREQLQLSGEHTRQHQQNVDELKQQVDILKLNAGDMSGADKKEIEKRINGYLKEIDRCIAILSE